MTFERRCYTVLTSKKSPR